MKPKLKLCGIRTIEMAAHAAACGCDYIGINMVPSSRRCVSATLAAAMVQVIGMRSIPVLVCRDLPIQEVIRVLKQTGATHIQLHGSEDPEYVGALQRMRYVVLKVITAIPSCASAAEIIMNMDRFASCTIVLDVDKSYPHESFSPPLINEICVNRAVMLAGGVSLANAPALLQCQRLWGLDIARGIETNKEIDANKIKQLCTLIHSHT